MTPLPEPDFLEARTDPHRYKRPTKKRKAVAIEQGRRSCGSGAGPTQRCRHLADPKPATPSGQ